MSRDHYKGIPKKRAALLNSDGDVEALEKGGDHRRISGTVALAAGTATVNDARFVSGGYALVAGQHPYPSVSGLNWFVGDGYLTISGSPGDFTIAYEVFLP